MLRWHVILMNGVNYVRRSTYVPLYRREIANFLGVQLGQSIRSIESFKKLNVCGRGNAPQNFLTRKIGKGASSNTRVFVMEITIAVTNEFARQMMSYTMKSLMLVLFCLIFSFNAMAGDMYRMTGLSPLHYSDSPKSSRLPLPVNPVSSIAVMIQGDHLSIYYGGDVSSDWCDLKIARKASYYFDANLLRIFGNADKLDNFLERKFHMSSKNGPLRIGWEILLPSAMR